MGSRGHPSSSSKDLALPSREGMLHAWLELYRVHLDLRTSFTFIVIEFVVFVLINLFEVSIINADNLSSSGRIILCWFYEIDI